MQLELALRIPKLKVRNFHTPGCNDAASYPESCKYTAFVVGTGGAELYPFETISPDNETRYQGHGYLDVREIINKLS